MKRVMLIAFHYPPFKGSSGLQRTLRYSMYLQQHGWNVDVLTVKPMAYAQRADDELKSIPESVKVHRALAFEARRHFSIAGRYPGFLARPDAWSSWYFDAVRRGSKLLREKSHDAIWSTYPIATAHKIGHALQQRSGIPWVADFRDLLTEENWPRDAKDRARLNRLEAAIVDRASQCVFTTPSATNYYRTKYNHTDPEQFTCLPNGYDESSFTGFERSTGSKNARKVLLHAGLLYPSERDPRSFFQAIAALKRDGLITANNLEVRLRATGHDDYYRPMLRDCGIDDIVNLAPLVSYREALQEMMNVDGLLVMQAPNCNRQIPAKLYEYFRAGAPILALTDGAGDTAALVRKEQAGVVCQIDSVEDIKRNLVDFLAGLDNPVTPPISLEAASRYSRQAQAGDFARLLDEVIARKPT